ncbi:uncharacterized protein LOC111085937 [Limulus polyphemus]|uniref:Uncharacterized protein LOC111085937 n=1 Tax=Limulus polyphemus TaxID=6850 RepID=A0ABM1SG03_LIMPO|nr:uncharacterized protein LOC111085937 [Limulus polyphemus]
MLQRRLIIILVVIVLVTRISAKEIHSSQDLQQEELANIPAEHRSYPQTQANGPVYNDVPVYVSSGGGPEAGVAPYVGGPGPGSVGSGPGNHHAGSPGTYPEVGPHDLWPAGRPDMPQINALNVKCEKNHMKVNIEFDRPFYGMIFSKGHYSDHNCVHLPPGIGHEIVNFEIFLGKCGMTSSQQQHGPHGGEGGYGGGLFIENTVIIQYDPQVQEIWDQARRLRCTWYDFYEKAVTFRPFNVDMLDAVTANFLGDNIQCWMQIQVGKGPWASEVAGIVKIGQTMTMVLAIKDDEHKFDMLVRNCIAHDGKSQPIQLVDNYGCVVRPKIMSRFQKVPNFGASASVVSYAYFQAFKFPDSMNVHFQCIIQVCRHECPIPQCGGDLGGGYLPAPRDQASAYSEAKPVNANTKPTRKEQKPSSSSYGISNSAQYSGSNNPDDEDYPSAFFNRNGEQLPEETSDMKISTGYAVSGTGGVGMPRSSDASPRSKELELNSTTRRRRQIPEATDIQTQRVIQVVAPGDVDFTLPLSGTKETPVDVYSSVTEFESSAICMSVPGFVAGLIILLLLLIVSSLVAAFLFLRVRHLTPKDISSDETVICNEHPEFLKSPSATATH